MALKRKSENREKIDPRSLLFQLTSDVTNKGVKLFEPQKNLNIDEDYLVLPRDITDCSGVDLGRYLNAFTQQRMYYRTVLSWQNILVEEKRRAYIQLSSQHYADLSRSKISETAKDKLINAEPDVYPAYIEYSDEKERLGLVEAALSSIEDGIFLISREISRRNQDWENESRNENVQTMRRSGGRRG